ncbi:MAG: nuclear transport factor 2 family protein [Actinomycetota bacterium]
MLETLRSFFELVDRRDFAALRELFTSDFVWHVSGPKRFAGDYHGFDGWMKYVAMLQREVGVTMKLLPIDFMLGDRHASVFMHVS